ncbi:VC2046/SO_2500 family protein [Colwellia piezophila]|uniref:VC2046/SO_2500 family protein n=1 Tax=Colwellia piezophila TaxID=211668 RepID=UPI001FE1B0B3|nr:VC2046/SO_2500 family protein [Colwellia piezophila]
MAQPITQNIKAFEQRKHGDLTPGIHCSNALLHELQLGKQLNNSVLEARRADFTLMLAMLAQDVREQSQFLMPKAEETLPIIPTDSVLRKEFNLPKKAPLALTDLDELTQFNQVQSIVDNNLADLRLSNVLQPKALAFRDDKHHIETQVITNTSLLAQLKHRKLTDKANQNLNKQLSEQSAPNVDEPLSQSLNQPLKFNAKAWLDGIEQSLVKAPLLN